MENLKHDLKYSFRTLLKNKAISVAAIFTLALGIGLNTTIFSLVDAILLRPLPYPNSDSIMTVITNWPQKAKSGFSAGNFLDLRKHSKSFESISAFGIWAYDVSGTTEPESLTACRATHGYFETFGMKPVLGRTFFAEEESEGKHHVAILTNSLWKRRFAEDQDIIGKQIRLDGIPHVIVGVMPEKFTEPPFVQIYTPLVFSTEQKQHRGASYLDVIARLKQGVTTAQAQKEMNLIASELSRQEPTLNDGIGIQIISAAEALTAPIKRTLLIFWGAVIFVLLVACANLANLLYASTASRDKEFALRASLGASPGRIRQQLLTESVMLSMIGGIIGILLSMWGIPAIVTFSPENTPRIELVSINTYVLLFSILLSVVAGILFGIVPAFRVSKHPLLNFLRAPSSGGFSDPGKVHLRDFLVMSQVAVVLVLLVGAGLLIRSFDRLRTVDPGFNPENVLNLQLFLPHSRYKEPDVRRSFVFSLMEKVRLLPQIESAAIASPAPFDSVPHLIDTTFKIEGRPPVRPGEEPIASYTRVTEDFFRTMQIPVKKGRSFKHTDSEKAVRVAIVNETLEKKFWPHTGAVGQKIILGVRQPVSVEIIGVVESVKQGSLSSAEVPQLYVPFAQSPSGAISLVVRTKGNPQDIFAALKTQLWAVDPALPAQYLSTAEHLVAESLRQPRSNAILLTLFAGLAFLLAMIGLYGVLAYSVSQRTREIGVRISLGAQQRSILKMILSRGILVVALGIALGTAGALSLTHLISSLLFEVNARDPYILISAAACMMIVSFIACYIPSQRAMKVDPIVALRWD